MLACYLTWHLRRAWAPLTFTDQDPPAPGNPVAPARRTRRRPGQGLRPARPGWPGLPQLPRAARARGHLDPQPGFTGTQVTVNMLTEPTGAQPEAFTLIGTPIPLTLT